MGESIKVSVLMLTFNQEQYVDEAIRGVVHQDAPFDFELVIGDDCSSDGTVAACRRWQEMYPDKIKIYENATNEGLLKNFVRTYNKCRGEYMAICEGDDYWIDKSKLRRQVQFLDSHPEFTTCVHRVVNYYQEDRSMSLSNGGQKSVNDILHLARVNFISNVSAVFRRGLFGELPEWIFDVATYDYAIHMLNAQYGGIYYMNRCMAVYRKHGKALWSRSGAEKQYRMAMAVRNKLIGYFSTTSRDDVLKILLEKYEDNAVALARYFLSENRTEEAAAVVDEILAVNANADVKKLEKRIHEPRVAKHGSLLTRMLKESRRMLSRMLPVPHAK